MRLRPVTEIIGRRDDLFKLPGASGPIAVTPDVIRNAIVRTDPRIEDFRVVQTGEASVSLILPAECADLASNAGRALNALFSRLGAQALVTTTSAPLSSPQTRKLRRVVREWKVSS